MEIVRDGESYNIVGFFVARDPFTEGNPYTLFYALRPGHGFIAKHFKCYQDAIRALNLATRATGLPQVGGYVD